MRCSVTFIMTTDWEMTRGSTSCMGSKHALSSCSIKDIIKHEQFVYLIALLLHKRIQCPEWSKVVLLMCKRKITRRPLQVKS